MKILIVRPWPSVLDVTKNTYNIQEVGLAKALVKRGHPTDILFWTDGDEMTVKVEVEGAKPINVFYRHGKVLLKNVWFKGQEKLFARYDVLQTAEYNQMFSWHLAGKYPKRRWSTTAPTTRPSTRTITGCAECSTPSSWGATAAVAPVF